MLTILTMIQYTLIYFFGIFFSFAFSKTKINKKNIFPILIFTIISGLIQIILYVYHSEFLVRLLYPFVTHIPLILLLHFAYKKRISTSMVSVTSSYLCCQPANWMGVMVYALSGNPILEQIVRIITIIMSGYILYLFKDLISEVYNKDMKTVYIFGIVPNIYYLYDHSLAVYTQYWEINNRVIVEFLPLFLCFIYMVCCIGYYHEEQQKQQAIHNEQLLRIALDQQTKEILSIKENELAMRLIRHDLRLLLNNLLYSINNDDKETSIHLISQYINEVDNTSVKRFCSNDSVNYVLSYYSNICKNHDVEFITKIMVDEISVDNLLFSSILSNALDNAFNAQIDLPSNRQILVSIKQHNGKILLSVKNHYHIEPIFENGIPISKEEGHGYGTQSIQYITNRLNGVCQFSIQDDYFVLRVII